MEPFFEDCLRVLENLHAQIETALDGLLPEALDWVPAGETNSMAVIAVHTAASERYWIGEVIAGEPSDRNRAAEFEARGLEAADLTARLSGSMKTMRTVLERLTLADLAEPRLHNGQETRVGYALAHTIEHVGQHAGHLGLTRQLWEQSIKR